MIEAPGKLVVLGEYAVLDGAPALVQAVFPGVCCTVEPHEDRETLTPTGDSRFVDAALDAIEAPPGRYRFTSDTHDLPGKPGLGGSAAATIAALRAGGADPDPALLTALGMRVHHAVQGSGSGIDVAASAWGGGLWFEGGECTPIAIPPFLTVYTGQSASTGPRVEAYRRWADRKGFVEESRELAHGFQDAPRDAVRRAHRMLCAMAERAGIAYRTPGIDAVVALAEAHGGAAKASGAGGGDSVIAFVDDLDALAVAVEAAGFAVVGVRPAPRAR